MLDKTLLDIIVCPNCKGPLKYLQHESQQGQDVLICEAEQLQYPIRDGIPVLLIDETVSMETKPAASENTPD